MAAYKPCEKYKIAGWNGWGKFRNVIALGKIFPATRTNRSIDWFTRSEGSTDGKSKAKANAQFDSSLLESRVVGTSKGLQQIHTYLFGGLYDFAGQIRQNKISKDGPDCQ
jgi:cell filamentation protein